MNEIRPSVYLGDYDDGTDPEYLKEKGIERVLNVSGAQAGRDVPREMIVHFNWYHIPLDDGPDNDQPLLKKAVITARALIKEGDLLVHCAMGASRSPAILAAALALEEDKEVQELVDEMHEKRGVVNPEGSLQNQVEDVVERIRKDNNPTCPECGSLDVEMTGGSVKVLSKCNDCGYTSDL